MEFDFNTLLFGILIGMNVIYAYILIRESSRKNRMRDEFAQNIAKAYEQLQQFTVLRVEKQEDMLYVYNMKTDEFVCQGETFDEVHDAYTKRFPGEKAIVGQGEELLFKERMNVGK